jgi:hypothetical protein
VLLLAPALFGAPLGPAGRLAMVVASFGLTILMRHLIENPARSAPALRLSAAPNLVAGGAVTALAVRVGLVLLVVRAVPQAGVSPATVQQVWAARGLKPHLVETFKLSNDPKFEEKLIDVVGLYLNPPEKAIVLCMDEKSSVQALDRTQPSLPMKQGGRRR